MILRLRGGIAAASTLNIMTYIYIN